MRSQFGINFEGRARIEPGADGHRLTDLSGAGSPPESTEPWRLRVWTEAPSQSPGQFGSELEIIGPTGERLSGQLEHGEVELISDAAGQAEAWRIALVFSAGPPSNPAGSVTLRGTVLSQGTFQASADIGVDTGSQGWRPPNAAPLDEGNQAAGASHAGPQPLSQKDSERSAEASLYQPSSRNRD
jgi:hypothetical protein